MEDADDIVQTPLVVTHEMALEKFKFDFSACQSLDDFARCFVGSDYTNLPYKQYVGVHKTARWQDLIVKDCQAYLSVLSWKLSYQQSPPMHSQFIHFLDWLQTAELDLQIFAYTRLIETVLPWELVHKEISYQYRATLNYLRRFMPQNKELLQLSIKKQAFEQNPCERDVVTAIYGEILKYYKAFRSDTHLSPYTSVVGPSGIGKSYVVSRIAKQGLAYVVYLSFAAEDSNSYPGRSIVADALGLEENNRDKSQRIFELFVATMLIFVRLCRELGITAAGFFDSQVKGEYEEFQRSVASLLREFQVKIFDDMEPKPGHPEVSERIRSDQYSQQFDHQEYLDKYLDQIDLQARQILEAQNQKLKASDDASTYISRKRNLKPKSEHPLALFCVDEAGGLLNLKGNPLGMKFFAFRRALRHQSKVSSSQDRKQSFALFLDTSSCVNDFSPPAKDDLSADFLHHSLFLPIWRIDTMDVFAGDLSDLEVVQVDHDLGRSRLTIDKAKLFSLGRPLWGTLMQVGNDGVYYAFEIAQALFRNGKENTAFDTNSIDLLALLSYRLNLYISLQSLAEELTSGFLRYIVKVSEDRAFIRTTQPSEPMLAYLSMDMMRQGGGKLRLELVKAMFRNAMEGFINVGDVGEAVAALVLLFSFDRVHAISLDGQGPSINIQCIPLTDFLGASLPPKIFREMETRARSKVEMARLWGGYVFFNHMVKLKEKPAAEILRQAFNRGAAMILPDKFPGADILIPVFIPEGNEMSYFIIQVKNRKDDSITRGETRLDANQGMKLATSQLPRVKAHLALMMCLQCTQGGSVVLYPQLKKRQKNGSIYSWNNMNRVVVLLCGLNLNLFPGLQLESKSTQPGAQESIDVMKKMLWCTAEDGDDGSVYDRRLRPLN